MGQQLDRLQSELKEDVYRILNELGVQLHPQKTRIVHVRQGFEFLGYKIKRGQRQLRLLPGKIRSGVQPGALYACANEQSGTRVNTFNSAVSASNPQDRQE
jgi:hypothetical protein